MCWMALIPVAMSVIGGMQQGNAQEAQAQSQARDMRTNADYANQAANDALNTGRINSDLQRLKTGQMIGSQRAAMAGNGGTVDTGSNSRLQEDTAQVGELDAMQIQNNAARQAYGLKVQATQGYENSRNTLLAGENAKRNSILGGVIKGAGSFFGGGGFGGGSGMGAGLTAGSASSSIGAGASSFGSQFSFDSAGSGLRFPTSGTL